MRNLIKTTFMAGDAAIMKSQSWKLIAIGLLISQSSWSLEQIIRPYQSVRAGGMGNVRLLTGLYDENFFGNPARVTANPKWKVQLPDPTFETTTDTISAVSDLVSAGDDILTNVADKTGTNLHGRIQTTFPGIYLPFTKWSFGFAMIMSTQFDVTLRKSFSINPQALTDVGPAFTVGRKLLEDDRLSVGLTTHLTYRISSRESYSFVDLLQGSSLSPSQSGGEGTHLDFDIGGTYRLPWEWKEFQFTVGAAINNILDGKYKNISFRPIDIGSLPRQQPRTYGFGASAERQSLWIFDDFIAALEFTDIGNNPNGSLFRTVHLGSEVRWTRFRFRAGINQGYWAAGLGINLWILEIDAASYGEEMSLNVGGIEDRRVALRISLQI